MNAKTIFAILLAVSAAASLGYREARQRSADTPDAAGQPPLPASGVVFYFFDSDVHCPACDALSANAREAIEQGFAGELATGALVWQTLDMDAPENGTYVKDFGLYAKSWVLAEFKEASGCDGCTSKMWDLTGDKDGCIEYIRKNTREFLGDAQ